MFGFLATFLLKRRDVFYFFVQKILEFVQKTTRTCAGLFLNLRKSVSLYHLPSVFDAEQPAEESYKDIPFLRFVGRSVGIRLKGSRVIFHNSGVVQDCQTIRLE
jgi:hypothetical protein